jgi:hypothetical protein
MVLRKLPELDYVLKFQNFDIDIIHWNAGLWDCVHRCGEEAHSDAVHYYTPMGTEAFSKKVLESLFHCVNNKIKEEGAFAHLPL